MNSKLNYNQQVDFHEDTHTYVTKEGVVLQGITGIIAKMLFPDKYKNIPQHILEKAAEYGSLIHSKCQTHDMFGGIPDCEEIEDYEIIKKDNNLIPLDNEYLVSDNQYIATLIDNVFYDSDKSVNLGDIKTTSILDQESLSWQLSICAYLFELQNPHLKVNKLFGIWIRKGKSKLQEVKRVDTNTVISLIDAYLNDRPFVIIKSNLEEIEELILIDSEMAILKERRDQIMQSILPQVKDVGKWSDHRLSISYVPETTSLSFDSKKFKEDNPDLAAKYEKKSTKAGYLKVTYKKEAPCSDWK